ncbi:putative sulfate exporter family transporter [Bradyrhizobium sp. Arg237L]|uniref:putative sulfate exporter family transporter n=1 Tax=Bradyrhizobium sp. Arg237L TaxID=3003352 RepID=UPI00249E74AA|nr:putative sulfate exporter family transporter [Bradyrhizobium sp. Arg237L]MDI4234033.1 putative sulfate exporter family transporter [Bradyrhizobium sp. Arg237L]
MSDIAVKTTNHVTVKDRLTEDWLSVAIGLLVFALALFSLSGVDLLGWAVTTSVYTSLSQALAPFAKGYAWLGGGASLFATYAALLVVLSIGVAALGGDVRKFVAAFTVTFAIAYASWIAGSYAYVAAVTPAEQQKFGIAWSLKLTNEGGFVVALLAGLVIANLFPRFAEWLKEAIRPELYIKIAIVILGATVAVTAAGRLNLASSILIRGAAAIIEAYLIYWAVVYFVARKWFGFSREWSVPLASGISICGVAAAIATGGAIRARPAVPVLVSSLVVVFAVVEVLILPFLAQTFLWQEPLVAGAWIGLAVKTDGAAVAGGGITEALITAKAAAEGIKYQPGWILATTATVKVFIDIFIGVWAFILGYIWTNYIDKGPDKAKPGEIWQRFPKFILGFVVVFAISLYLALGATPEIAKALPAAAGEANVFRVIFFILTFFSIGVLSDFRKLWQQGFGKLAAVYFVSLFGFVIWVGLLISWLFFSGVKPPLAS